LTFHNVVEITPFNFPLDLSQFETGAFVKIHDIDISEKHPISPVVCFILGVSEMRNVLLRCLILFPLCAVCTPSFSGDAAFGPIITSDNLEKILENDKPLILDIRGNNVKDGYIPGAISVNYSAFRGPKNNPGQLVTNAHLTSLFQKLGIRLERPVVVVFQGRDATDFGAAARVYWTLKSAGIRKIAILNGGMNDWKSGLKRAIRSTPSEPEESGIIVTLRDDWLASRADILAIVDGSADAKLIDARPNDFYKGKKQHPAAARPGTLPKSGVFPHTQWFQAGATIHEESKANKILQAAGFTSDKKLVSFCNTGHWAATNWFALSELSGLKGVKLYPESMVGWSNADLPMDNTPSLWQNFLNKF